MSFLISSKDITNTLGSVGYNFLQNLVIVITEIHGTNVIMHALCV